MKGFFFIFSIDKLTIIVEQSKVKTVNYKHYSTKAMTQLYITVSYLS